MQRRFKQLAIRALQQRENRINAESITIDLEGKFQLQWFPVRLSTIHGTLSDGRKFWDDGDGHLISSRPFMDVRVGEINYLTGVGKLAHCYRDTKALAAYYFESEHVLFSPDGRPRFEMTLVSTPVLARTTRLRPNASIVWCAEEDQNLESGSVFDD